MTEESARETKQKKCVGMIIDLGEMKSTKYVLFYTYLYN